MSEMPPLTGLESWTVGRNLAPDEQKQEAAEGEYEVRMTFADPGTSKAWLFWLIKNDPAWRQQEQQELPL